MGEGRESRTSNRMLIGQSNPVPVLAFRAGRRPAPDGRIRYGATSAVRLRRSRTARPIQEAATTAAAHSWTSGHSSVG
ncbi:hypothetical protein GCM10009853_013610 [Glycomyces scopariae]